MKEFSVKKCGMDYISSLFTPCPATTFSLQVARRSGKGSGCVSRYLIVYFVNKGNLDYVYEEKEDSNGKDFDC